MLTFLTLFLGLVVGPHDLELAVSGPIASVELLLDDQAFTTLTAPPWKAVCDFGDALSPHEIVAIARDRSGREITRLRQWVNLPRSQAEVGVIIEESAGARYARVIWQNLDRRRPIALAARFDGELLASDGLDRFILPSYDPKQIHIVSAEVELDGVLVHRADLALGGDYGSIVGSELTAIALDQTGEPRAVRVEDLSGALVRTTDPAALRVTAVDRNALDLVVVVDPVAERGLGALASYLQSTFERRTNSRNLGSTDTLFNDRGRVLGPGDTVRFLSTTASEQRSPDLTFEVFPVSQAFRRPDGDLDFLLTHIALQTNEGKTSISDSVAAGAVLAAATGRPRAVLLIVGADSRDQSRFSAAVTRAYLEQLRVPLIVWTIGPRSARRDSEDRLPLLLDTAWGPARHMGSPGRFVSALIELRRRLEKQLVAWVEGGHLPQRVIVAAGRSDLVLAR